MESTKDRILSVSLSAFASRGYNAVGVQDICDQANITKPTLYYHFGSKRGLLTAIAEDHFGTFLNLLSERGTYRGDVASSLTSSMDVFLGRARSDGDFVRLRLALSFSPPESEEHAVFRPFSEKLYTFFSEFFRAAAEDHGNMRDRELAYAASFIGTADAYSGLILAGILDPAEDFLQRVVHHFMHGIFS